MNIVKPGEHVAVINERSPWYFSGSSVKYTPENPVNTDKHTRLSGVKLRR